MRHTTRKFVPVVVVGAIVLAACGSDDPTDSAADSPSATTEASATTDAAGTSDAPAGADCSATITDGALTVATGEPAFFPWVIDDAPESGEVYESAVAYAVAEKMGYAADAVTWVRTTFDAAVQPGQKDFDFNLQQFSITDERSETVDFSLPYYTSNQAIVALAGSKAEGVTTLAGLKDVKFGAQAGTTSLDFINDVIKPNSEVFVYDDNVGAKAALEANQIDAAVFDLPTALYVSGVEIEGSSVTGQFPAESGGTTDQFGLVLEKDSPLTPCVNDAMQQLIDDGTLDALATQWLADNTGAPVISE